MVKTMIFQNDTLQTKNQLMAIKESSTMIHETSKEQHRKDLERFLRERRRATEHEDAAAAKILKLEEEIASLQEALTSDAQDAEARAELERFMKIRKESALLSTTMTPIMGQGKMMKTQRPLADQVTNVVSQLLRGETQSASSQLQNPKLSQMPPQVRPKR